MDKDLCHIMNYELLSIEDPKEYPSSMDPSNSLKIYSSDGGSCTYNLHDDSVDYETYNFEATIQDCDCSDPKNYDFYDEGRF